MMSLLMTIKPTTHKLIQQDIIHFPIFCQLKFSQNIKGALDKYTIYILYPVL